MKVEVFDAVTVFYSGAVSECNAMEKLGPKVLENCRERFKRDEIRRDPDAEKINDRSK